MKKTLFLLSDDELLPLINVRPLSKLMDRSRTEGETVSTLRWWSVADSGAESFKEIHGQVENRRRKCFYFAMMIRCCWWMCVLQANWWTGKEPKEKMFLLCDDDLLLLTDLESFKYIDRQVDNRLRNCFYLMLMILLLLIDLRPSKTFSDRWRTEGENVFILWYWCLYYILVYLLKFM